jgi:hypothetical protein
VQLPSSFLCVGLQCSNSKLQVSRNSCEMPIMLQVTGSGSSANQIQIGLALFLYWLDYADVRLTAHQTIHLGLCTALISIALALISNCQCTALAVRSTSRHAIHLRFDISSGLRAVKRRSSMAPRSVCFGVRSWNLSNIDQSLDVQ